MTKTAKCKFDSVYGNQMVDNHLCNNLLYSLMLSGLIDLKRWEVNQKPQILNLVQCQMCYLCYLRNLM